MSTKSLRAIRELADQFRTESDRSLAAAFANVREEIDGRGVQRDAMWRVFAFATESVRRTTGKTFHDVQLYAGEVLARGQLAEMATGEGKTLVTLLPALWAVATGNQTHVATTNSYLAERDYQEVAPAAERLGVTIGLLPEEPGHTDKKRSAYQCDITYGTGYEFGFDYLRDQLSIRQNQPRGLGDRWLNDLLHSRSDGTELVQPKLQTCLVDEVDSVLIDEANTPLVLSFYVDEKPDVRPFRRAAEVASRLCEGNDFRIVAREQTIEFSDQGRETIRSAGEPDAEFRLNRPWPVYIQQALRAVHLLHRDIDYVVRGGAVQLIDQYTGRIFPERKWRDGLHQAVECKETVELSPETLSHARVSRQRYFQLYASGTGLTGTAFDAAQEFHRTLGLNVIPIPLNVPSRRSQLPHRFFADPEAKLDAIVQDARWRQGNGQPVLIGTRSIDQSCVLAELLKSAGVAHQVLNGVQDAEEATIIAAAGRESCVTVATNMAGRGTDIKPTPDALQSGGLHVIVAEPNRSRRIDRQIIGRSARQGQPGSSQVYVSAEDEVLRHYGYSAKKKISSSVGHSGGSDRNLDGLLRECQQAAEKADLLRREHLLRQELWVSDVLESLVGEG